MSIDDLQDVINNTGDQTAKSVIYSVYAYRDNKTATLNDAVKLAQFFDMFNRNDHNVRVGYDWMANTDGKIRRYKRRLESPEPQPIDDVDLVTSLLGTLSTNGGKRLHRKSRKRTNKRRKMKRRTKHYRPNNR